MAALAERYRAAFHDMPKDHGHCFEVAALAAELARDHGLAAQERVGLRRCSTGLQVIHAWLELPEGIVVHSPHVGMIEATPLGPDFQASDEIPFQGPGKFPGA